MFRKFSKAIEEQNSEYTRYLRSKNVTLRPIEGKRNSVNQHLTHLLDLILKLIQDDIDFLHDLPKNVDKYASLVSFDALCLYPNILPALGIYTTKH